MPEKIPTYSGSQIRRGDPISKPGTAKKISDLERAIRSLEIYAGPGLRARIEWANGVPRIYIELTE